MDVAVPQAAEPWKGFVNAGQQLGGLPTAHDRAEHQVVLGRHVGKKVA
jgi:hypothetical protein